jgi:antitoxin MazE
METTAIKKWGNSQGIIIPKSLLNSLKWQTDEKITLRVEDKKILIEQAPENQPKNIKELFKGFNIANYMPQEIDWGKPTGGELW